MSDEKAEVSKENKKKKPDMSATELITSFFILEGDIQIPKANIADLFDDDTLQQVGQSVVQGFDADKTSMVEWEGFVEHGLNLIKQEKESRSTPWDGASNFKSPTLMQAALKFSDRASTELLRQDDIVKTSVIGSDESGEKAKQADRVAEYSNFQINVEMEEWRDEHETLIYKLPYDGCAFKETFFDRRLGRPVSNVIVYPDFVVNNKTKSISRMRRFSTEFDLTKNDIVERRRQRLWLDVEITHSSEREGSENQAEADELTTFIEQRGFFDLDGDGYEEPYIFTVLKSSGQVMRITPRFELEDVLVKDGSSGIKKLSGLANSGNGGEFEIVRIKQSSEITKYGFLKDPEGGFLDIGYSYLLGALTSAINATTNQIVDAGTLDNLGGGFLAKGFRKKMGDTAFKPGEWKSTSISAQDLQNGMFSMPTKGPSNVLFSMMQFMIQSSQELSASADLSQTIGANAPATTTLALVQEQQQSAGAIILRIYRAMSEEFKKLFAINSKFLDPNEYAEVLDDPDADFVNDFNLRSMNIVPVANPEISSKIQRIQLAQAEISQVELVAAAGGDIRVIVKNYYEAIGSKNVELMFPDLEPQELLQKLLSENPDLAELISGEAERMDLLAAAEADRIEGEEQRADLKASTEADKAHSETKKIEAETVLTFEKAETEGLNNSISTYTAELELDNKDLQNKQALQDLQQPQEPSNGTN